MGDIEAEPAELTSMVIADETKKDKVIYITDLS